MNGQRPTLCRSNEQGPFEGARKLAEVFCYHGCAVPGHQRPGNTFFTFSSSVGSVMFPPPTTQNVACPLIWKTVVQLGRLAFLLCCSRLGRESWTKLKRTRAYGLARREHTSSHGQTLLPGISGATNPGWHSDKSRAGISSLMRHAGC